MKETYDVVVAGAGVAGIRVASALCEKGIRVALVDPTVRRPQEKSLFIDFSKFPSSLKSNLKYHPINGHKLINADDPNRDWGKTGEYSTGAVEYWPIFQALIGQLPCAVDIIPSAVVNSCDDGNHVEMEIGNRNKTYRVTSKHLIDASGDRSMVSRRHKTLKQKALIEDDPLVVWMMGVRAVGTFDPDIVFDPIGRDIGSTSWVTPLSDTQGDIIAAGVSPLSRANLAQRKKTLNNLITFCKEREICEVTEVTDLLGGVLRSEPISLDNASRSKLVWQTGQAAGMTDPLMGEAFSPAYLHAEALAEHIATGKTPKDFYHYWRYSKEGKMFDYDVMLAMLKRRMLKLEQGIVGSNFAIYQSIMELMSDAAIEMTLRERKLPMEAYMPLMRKILLNKELRQTVTELLGIYAQTLINTNIIPRLKSIVA